MIGPSRASVQTWGGSADSAGAGGGGRQESLQTRPGPTQTPASEQIMDVSRLFTSEAARRDGLES